MPSVIALMFLVTTSGLSLLHQLWWQERLLKLQAEQTRNRALAEALLSFAKQDWLAAPVLPDGSPNWRQQMGQAAQTHVFFPHTLDEREVLRARLAGAPCRQGICLTDSLGTDSTSLSRWLGRVDQAWCLSSSLLPDARLACYWVEVLLHADDLKAEKRDAPRFFYRVTALVQGSLPGARVALQSVWQSVGQSDLAPTHGPDGTWGQGRWLSWRWLSD